MPPPTTRNLTILLTDIKGFTDRTSRISRSAISALLENHTRLVLPILEGHGGKLIKSIGDAFLMTFESPTEAVVAGKSVQETLIQYNAGKAADERIDIRVAINVGEVILEGGDIFGEAVNITARIEAIADAGEVFFTDAVYLSMNKKEVPSSVVGVFQLKGIPEGVRVHRVRRELASLPVPAAKPDNKPVKLAPGPEVAAAVSSALHLEGFFDEFTIEHLEKLFPRSGLFLYPAGFRLIEQDEAAHEIFIICEGGVEISKTFGSAAASLARLEKGDIVGEMAFVSDSPRSASAIVLRQSRIFRLAFEDLQYIYKNNPELTAHLRGLAQQRR